MCEGREQTTGVRGVYPLALCRALDGSLPTARELAIPRDMRGHLEANDLCSGGALASRCPDTYEIREESMPGSKVIQFDGVQF